MATHAQTGDSSEEERMHLNETSCLLLSGRVIVGVRYDDLLETSTMPPIPLPEVVVPLQAQVCRSLLRLDVRELHFDDCVPGGSFVKDFTVWNRSEIPLLFKLVSSVAAFAENRELLTFTDFNTGYAIGERTLQAAAYGHVRIRVTYRPEEVGERFFEVHVQNLHDARNVKILKIHGVTNKEHHREGLSIKEPDGSYLMSGSKLDFGDCYTGIATSRTLLIRNATEAPLHVELTSERPKEMSFELKLAHNRTRSSRALRTEDVVSPTDSNDGSSRKGSLSPDAAKSAAAAFASFDAFSGYGVDSDDDPDENEGDYLEDDFAVAKRMSFDEVAAGEVDDDDEFEFDGEPRQAPRPTVSSPKSRSGAATESRRRVSRQRSKRAVKPLSRVRDLAYESGLDSAHSVCSSPERKSRTELRRRNSASGEETNGANFLVETIDLPPGVERMILIWYCPSGANPDGNSIENPDSVDYKTSRLTKQTFRISFRCFQIQGSWQQGQSRVYDRTLGKSIHIRARTCTSIVTATPSILHLGDCNIGELKSSSCMLTNHSELPTVVKPLVTSKVISTVPNDEITLGPKQSLELKIEIIPRKINPNYSRLISIMNMKNKANIPQVCVRSSNMDAHHVIYHSLFYKLLTPSKSAFLNFDHVVVNSIGIQVFDLENITSAPLQLSLVSSDPARLRLFAFRIPFGEIAQRRGRQVIENQKVEKSGLHSSLSSISVSSQGSSTTTRHGNGQPSGSTQVIHRHSGRIIRRRRSIGCLDELISSASTSAKKTRSILRGYISKKSSYNSSGQTSAGWLTPTGTSHSAIENNRLRLDAGATTPPESVVSNIGQVKRGSFSGSRTIGAVETSLEMMSLLELFEMSRAECDRYCHSTVANTDKENEIVGMIRERSRRFQRLVLEKKLVPLNGTKDRNLRIPAKSQQRIIAVLSPSLDAASRDASKSRIEKHKILLTLPPGGNKKAVADVSRFDLSKAAWAISKHPFDSRPSVRELLVKSRVCRSIMNVNQKNINFGRITVSSRSSKRLVVQNMSAVPLVYSVEKTGSISSGFLEIKEGEVGVVKAFGTKDILFEFQPTLAGPFEEKLRIINVQDPENSISITIKAKVVKRETFKLLQSGQVLSLGKCLVGEKTQDVKIAVRNTSRKRREYVIQLDPAFSNLSIRPTFHFEVDESPSAIITQAQEKKLDEELEKLEHKLRIAVTKKKGDKIKKLNDKISRVKALLSGEQLPDEEIQVIEEREQDDFKPPDTPGDVYDSNSESEFSETEAIPRTSRRQKRGSKTQLSDQRQTTSLVSQSANSLVFTLEAEATGRIIAHATFHPLRLSLSGDESTTTVDGTVPPRSQKARKRQLRKDSAPMVGVGKLLLFEQQNKDVVKELQYNAEVFPRTAAGESAYYRAVGKAPLPPVPHGGISRASAARRIEMSFQDIDRAAPTSSPSPPVKPDHSSDSLAIKPADGALSESDARVVTIEPGQVGMVHRSRLLIPIEESPSSSLGWTMTLAHKRSTDVTVEVAWTPMDTIRGLFAVAFDVKPGDRLIASHAGVDITEQQHACVPPLRIHIPPEQSVALNARWYYTSGSGFASSTSLSSCVGSSMLELISKNQQGMAGKLEFRELQRLDSPPDDSIIAQTIEVGIVKTTNKTLQVDDATIDLGQHQQDTEVRGSFVVRNHSRQAARFLVLTPTAGRDSGSGSTGEFTFESSTGRVEAHSWTSVNFVYRGTTPGQHSEQILVRNLGDRLNTAVVTVNVRVIRPVYVRIPELDQHSTGKLEVLDLGYCYVTPEMQDTSVDSPNISLKFSKVHKITLTSQVTETLVLCAASNLKTQCYVYEDSRLYREATNVVMGGKQTQELFIALRPRLPSDAFKTGSARDLVGGIRVQLFRYIESGASDDDRGEMVAEFTIKFVGTAGASLARVSPTAIDFGVEQRYSDPNACASHQGRFEVANMSKSLPFDYRLFVSNEAGDYSDCDDGLEVLLEHNNGKVPPGETSIVAFDVKARMHGLFRRRILIENTHFPGKVSTVDVTLFVDNGSLSWMIDRHQEEKSGDVDYRIDMGTVPVIRVEDELAQHFTRINGDFEPRHQRFRINSPNKCSLGNFVEADVERRVLLRNTTDADLIIRPISSLPLVFNWSQSSEEPVTGGWLEMLPAGASATLLGARKLHSTIHSTSNAPSGEIMYLGGVYKLESNSSCWLQFRFASLAATPPIPADTIAAGKVVPFSGMIGIQCFGNYGASTSADGHTLKVIPISGRFGQPQFEVSEREVLLGKIGYALGWTSTPFKVNLKNTSEMPAFFAIGNMPPWIIVRQVSAGIAVPLTSPALLWQASIPSLRSLALQVEDREHTTATAWMIPPLEDCDIDLEFVQSEKPLGAGHHEFNVKFFNILNPRNTEKVAIDAQIVSTYAEVIVDPESSGGDIGASQRASSLAFLPPVTIPPQSDGSPHGPSFWFSVKNVFDEDLSVKLTSDSLEPFARISELRLFSRSSNTPISNLLIGPSESADIRVVCSVSPSARITSEMLPTGNDAGNLVTFGRVYLDICVQSTQDAAQRKEILVKGQVIPGRTFTLSSSSLHFHAVAVNLPETTSVDALSPPLKTEGGASTPADSSCVHMLRTSSETFWIRNPSTVQHLNFAIDQVPMYNPGLCLIEGSSCSDMCAMSEYVQAVAVPSSGSIGPGEQVKVVVRLEEASMLVNASADPLIEGDEASMKAAAFLHKMRHHPSWRSNSWGAEVTEPAADPSLQNHMYLTVRDVDMPVESSQAAEVDVHLVLQAGASSAGTAPDQSRSSVDMDLIRAAFVAREKRMAARKRSPALQPLATVVEREFEDDVNTLDQFEEFDVGTIHASSVGRRNHLPTLSIRGCTPAENSSLENARYVIDVGQHSVRKGGEVEWEITIESSYSQSVSPESSTGEPIEYRLYQVEKGSGAWFRLSRDRGTLDRNRSYQSVVLYFFRDVIGVFSTFIVLQNVTNPGDLKVIQVKLEVVADLNSLRSMASGIDPASNVFRVLVSNHGGTRKSRRLSEDAGKLDSGAISSSSEPRLLIDYGEVYYNKLYLNHSIVIENSSSMTLDFMLASNARPNEVGFSVSPTSLTEVSAVTLAPHGRMQVFLHFRPLPKQEMLSFGDTWNREIEVYISCRLVKDFRETVLLKAICHPPQLVVQVSTKPPIDTHSSDEAQSVDLNPQPNFLGFLFSAPDVAASDQCLDKYLIVRNTRSDCRARIALRNDSMFFLVSSNSVDDSAGTVDVDHVENGVCAGRRSTILATLPPLGVAVFKVSADTVALRNNRQVWESGVREHISLYNIKQFAEHYQVALCFTSSDIANYYVPPSLSESSFYSALEDTIAKFLQNYHATWKWLLSYHTRQREREQQHKSASLSTTFSPARIASALSDLEAALDQSSPLSPRRGSDLTSGSFTEAEDLSSDRETLRQLLQSYRALYFDFYYITDELVWYGVRSNAVRHSLMLADLAYGVVFNHEIFRAFLAPGAETSGVAITFPRLLLPWIRQLRHFLSYFPENHESTLPLRHMYQQLHRFETAA
ncbi:hypothetical protein PINS_up003549 [Pythium insidiosum]|nr:hypothetical protein PINS_up003549 [Pythium insidiosum]